jgi:hypothetical protein
MRKHDCCNCTAVIFHPLIFSHLIPFCDRIAMAHIWSGGTPFIFSFTQRVHMHLAGRTDSSDFELVFEHFGLMRSDSPIYYSYCSLVQSLSLDNRFSEHKNKIESFGIEGMHERMKALFSSIS